MKLGTRITISIILLLISASLLLGYVSTRQLSDAISHEDTVWSQSMAVAIAKAITTDTIEHNKAAVREVIKRVISNNHEVIYIIVVDFDSEVFTSTFNERIPENLLYKHNKRLLKKPRLIDVDGIQVKEISYPLIENLDAHLHIGINTDANKAHINSATQSQITYAALITILGSFIAIWLGHLIAKPIAELSNKIQSYGRGILIPDSQTPPTHILEIDRLTSNFTDMVVQLESEHQELEQIKYTLDQTLDCVFMFDSKSLQFFYVNQGAMNLVGYSHDELMQMTPYDIKPDYDENTFRQLIAPFLNGDTTTTTFNTRHKHKDGHIIPVEIFLQYIRLKHDAHFVAIVRDISERIATEKQLKQMNEELEKRVEERTARIREQATILDQIHDSVISTDINGIITSWNKGAERLFGFSREEAIGKNISFIYPADQLNVLQDQVIKPLFENGEHETQVEMLNKAGERFHALLSLSLKRDKAGNATGMIGYTLDITDRIKAEQSLHTAIAQAELASKSKTEFLSRMSHELRTPMNAILGFSQLLEQNISGKMNDEEISYVQEVIKGGNHLLELINEVLDLSRVESGRLQVSLEDVELCQLIKESITLIKPLAEQSSIDILFPDEDKTFTIHADRMRMKQVLINILSNAVKYNCKNGKITINCHQQDSTVITSITDTGPGIPESLHGRVFEPFDRLAADTTAIEGTGIGLSLTKKLVEFMHGTIDFTSVPDQGTTFHITMKLTSSPSYVEQEQKQAQAPEISDGEYTVLYVEDNPANLRLVSRILKTQSDITLYDAHTASLAMDLIHTHNFDLILLDIHLSGEENGFDILRQLRADPATRNIPVIAISANATPHDIKHGLSSGFDDYITKPIDISHFTKTVNRFLQ